MSYLHGGLDYILSIDNVEKYVSNKYPVEF